MFHTMLSIPQYSPQRRFDTDCLFLTTLNSFFPDFQFVGQTEGPLRGDERAAIDLLVEVDIVPVEEAIQKLDKCGFIKVFVDGRYS